VGTSSGGRCCSGGGPAYARSGPLPAACRKEAMSI